MLQGMTRLLNNRSLRLIAEWHPSLQQAAGHEPNALPQYLLDLGFNIQVVTHTYSAPLHVQDIPNLTAQLLKKRSPVELFAFR